jgi:hypothetical protein
LSSSEGSILTAGEAGIVLSRFLPSETPALRSEEVKGLVLVRCVLLAVVLEAGVVGVLLFEGLSVLARATGFLSDVGEGWIVALLSGVADTAFVRDARPNVPPASDILFAGFPIPLGFFSSPEAPDLLLSSFEARDG